METKPADQKSSIKVNLKKHKEINTKVNHITKLLKIPDEQKILKTAREKRHNTYTYADR